MRSPFRYVGRAWRWLAWLRVRVWWFDDGPWPRGVYLTGMKMPRLRIGVAIVTGWRPGRCKGVLVRRLFARVSAWRRRAWLTWDGGDPYCEHCEGRARSEEGCGCACHAWWRRWRHALVLAVLVALALTWGCA